MGLKAQEKIVSERLMLVRLHTPFAGVVVVLIGATAVAFEQLILESLQSAW